MSDLLRELWSRAEWEEPVFSAEEVEWARPGQFELLCNLGLLKETDRATWARCEACGDGHVESVIWVQNATTGRSAPFVPCPENGGASVSIERLSRWAIDLDATAQAIRNALGLIGNDSVLLPGRVWFLGRRHVAGRFRDFFFVLGAAREDAHMLWDRCRQIEDAPSPVILVPSETPAERKTPAFRVADLAAITEDRLVMDLDYLADALPRNPNSAPAKTVASFPIMADATWSELRLVVREHTIVAQLRNEQRQLTFGDLGMSGPDDRLWRLLCLFASNGGHTPALPRTASSQQAATFRKQISDLRRRLQTVFPIAAEPIRAHRHMGGYHCSFTISLDRRDGFPIQPNKWEHCTFQELLDGRIRISAEYLEFFEAHTVSDENRRAHPETAQRFGSRSEVYDLRVLGLAAHSGVPTSEGRLLLDLLRRQGKVIRPGGDQDVLQLGTRLREWMGIPSSPMRFTVSRNLWTACFQCESDRSDTSTVESRLQPGSGRE